MATNRYLLVERVGDTIRHHGEVDREEAVPRLILGVAGEREDYVLRPTKLSKTVESVSAVKRVFWVNNGPTVTHRGNYVEVNEGSTLVETNFMLLEMEE